MTLSFIVGGLFFAIPPYIPRSPRISIHLFYRVFASHCVGSHSLAVFVSLPFLTLVVVFAQLLFSGHNFIRFFESKKISTYTCDDDDVVEQRYWSSSLALPPQVRAVQKPISLNSKFFVEKSSPFLDRVRVGSRLRLWTN